MEKKATSSDLHTFVIRPLCFLHACMVAVSYGNLAKAPSFCLWYMIVTNMQGIGPQQMCIVFCAAFQLMVIGYPPNLPGGGGGGDK